MRTSRERILDYLPADIFNNNLPATPENINWMYAVACIDDGDGDLESMLETMNKHYTGPISIHEGHGGCEADSNQELIIQKIRFDMRENPDSINVEATLEAVRLGWIGADEYQEFLDDE